MKTFFITFALIIGFGVIIGTVFHVIGWIFDKIVKGLRDDGFYD